MSASIFCSACGAANGPANPFCSNCGASLAPRAAAPPGYPPAGYPPLPPSPYPVFPPPAPYYPMRTAGATDIMSGMFEVWTKNFKNFFLVYLALALANGAIVALLSYALFGTFAFGRGVVPSVPTTATLVAILAFAIISVVISVIITSIVTGGMTEYAVRRFRGEAMTFRQALERGLQRFLSILGANVLLTLTVFALVVLPLLLIIPILIIGAGNPASVLVAICGLLLAVVFGGVIAIFVYVSLSLYAPAIMMENVGAVRGLQRSWALTKGHRWSLLGTIILTAILGAIISFAITLPAGFGGNTLVSIVAAALASAIVGPWIVILIAVAYDLIERSSGQFYVVPPPYAPWPTPPPPGSPPAPP